MRDLVTEPYAETVDLEGRGSQVLKYEDSSLPLFWQNTCVVQFIKFCLVGGSGLVMDMTFLLVLADPRFLALNITLSKICAAELALVNNFILNELWTFRRRSLPCAGFLWPQGRLGIRKLPWADLLRRFLLFNAICGVGIGMAVLLLHVFHTWLGWNLYVANFSAIILVTFWNFGVNARLNWR